MECFDLDSTAVKYALNEGDVRFSQSETQASPKIYLIETRYEDRLLQLKFELGDSLALLKEVALPFKNFALCDCP
jgi:hypothetical protein